MEGSAGSEFRLAVGVLPLAVLSAKADPPVMPTIGSEADGESQWSPEWML